MVGGFVAATVVTLLQFLRLRDRRLLLLAAMFACQAQALAREWHDGWKDVYQAGVCAAGLLLLLALSPRPPHGPAPAPLTAAPATGPRPEAPAESKQQPEPDHPARGAAPRDVNR